MGRKDSGETPLHQALRRRDYDAVRKLVTEASTDDAQRLVNAKAAGGLTPLMIAAMSPGADAEAAAQLLLAHGAERTVTAHGYSRRTAADYAREHGQPQLAETLQALADAQASAGSGTVWRDPCGSAGRCALCGDRVGGESKFRALRRQLTERPSLCQPATDTVDEPVSALLAGFFSDPLVSADVIESLSVPELHHINRRRGFSRELSEAVAMLSSLRDCAEVIDADGDGGGAEGGGAEGGGAEGGGAEGGDFAPPAGEADSGAAGLAAGPEEGATGVGGRRERRREGLSAWHVVDLCCGKSFVSAVVSRLFPRCHVTAIDRVPPRFVPHYAEAGITNVAYVQRDILAADFGAFVGDLARAHRREGRRTIVLGMHLCGELSTRAVDVFLQTSALSALVLAPCCLPAARAAAAISPTLADVYATKRAEEQYSRWCTFLQERLRPAGAGAGSGGAAERLECTRTVVPGLVSVKSTLLAAVRRPGLVEAAPPGAKEGEGRPSRPRGMGCVAQASADELEPATELLALPDELLAITARMCLEAHLPAAVRLATQTCHGLRARLHPVALNARPRRLQWSAAHTVRHQISNDGRTLTKTHANGHDCACAAGPLLPTTGRSAWKVRIDECSDDGEGLFIGVCDAHCRSEWGLEVSAGVLVHLGRNHRGQIVASGDHRASRPLGESVRFRGRAAGAVVEVTVDHDAGTLRFRVNDGAPVEAASPPLLSSVLERDGRRGNGHVEEVQVADRAPDGLASGAALRPYASLGLARGASPDRVTFCGGYVYSP